MARHELCVPRTCCLLIVMLSPQFWLARSFAFSGNLPRHEALKHRFVYVSTGRAGRFNNCRQRACPCPTYHQAHVLSVTSSAFSMSLASKSTTSAPWTILLCFPVSVTPSNGAKKVRMLKQRSHYRIVKYQSSTIILQILTAGIV